jgi:hypothetical protein
MIHKPNIPAPLVQVALVDHATHLQNFVWHYAVCTFIEILSAATKLPFIFNGNHHQGKCP